MEASQEGQSDPQDQPETASEQGVQSDPQDQPETVSESQQEPTQDSGLQTPQPDQPVPTEEERQAQEAAPLAEAGPSGQPAEGTVTAPSFPSNEEQQDAAVQRQAEVDEQRQLHNERTGGGEVTPGEVDAQREEHNARVAGQDVSDASQLQTLSDQQDDAPSEQESEQA